MTSFFEQSDEIGSAMFSFTSHTMGKQDERKKTDRKTGKERRKAEKTLHYSGISVEPVLPSIDTIWCIGRGGHWGTPMLDDLGLLIRPDFCVDCQHSCDKHEKATEATEATDESMWFSAMEHQLDIMEAMQEQVRLEEEERRILEEQKIQRLQFMENLLIALRFAEEEKYEDDYIPEIDDNFDD